MTLLGLAAAAALALPAEAQQRIPVGHLMDNSGATSDVGVPYGQGVADTLAWVNASRNGIGGRPLNVLGFDYGYQAPRAVSQYQAWSRDKVVAIQGWGTADTEALVRFVTRDRIPYISGSYSAALTDAGGKSGRQGVEAGALQLLLRPILFGRVAGDAALGGGGLEGRGRPGQAEIRPYGRQPPLSEFAEGRRRGAGGGAWLRGAARRPFRADAGRLHRAMPDPEEPGRQLRLSRQYRGLQHLGPAGLPDGGRAGAVPRQCLGDGRERHEGRRRRGQRGGLPGPHRRGLGPAGAGDGEYPAISRISDPSGTAYRPVHYLAGVCAAMLMVEAMDSAAANGGEITGERIRNGFYARQNWVPAGFDGVCKPSTFTAEDHRGTLRVALYRAVVSGDTARAASAT